MTVLDMGNIHDSESVLLLVAASSRYAESLAWTRARCESYFGPVALASEAFDFTETDYYEATMGAGLKKQFLAFEQGIDPGVLADIKRQTNSWEVEYASLGRHAEPRPLNLDPGYITLAKLVLASTKDFAHRIHLRDGIYGEVTLAYRHKQWQAFEWTYPDYRRADYQRYFSGCRDRLQAMLHSGA
ncbi:MAG: DUF4416 family protein [Planctomycetes bacterium]|nr:DUF4416 family protein [Planctomycetota bacterium]